MSFQFGFSDFADQLNKNPRDFSRGFLLAVREGVTS
jgi:hypothetical protein